ncbi:plasmid pRiA4b ORF-3 family protein [Proteiniclasticum sp. C24MP]|uniref:plasmid pRiA4b ORF-3 family protein n=1 Tax=Proteiniclasticum sp. C24MP TaxID=3374101 RepID=UPI003755028C
MIIQCTKVLGESMGRNLVTLEESQKQEQHPLGLWHAHMTKVNRRNTVIMVNEETLYAVVLYGVKKKEFLHLEEEMEKGIRKALKADGYNDQVISEYFKASPAILLARETNRSIQGKITMIKRSLEYSKDLDPAVIHQSLVGAQLNTYCHRMKDDRLMVPEEEMHRELEKSFSSVLEHLPIREFQHYELKIRLKLDFTDIWRRVSVPSYYSFRQLSHVILTLFDWQDYHIHEYIVKRAHGKMLIVQMDEDPDRLFSDSRDTMELKQEQFLPLEEIFREDVTEITYVYDLGDYWEHEIQVEKMTMREEKLPLYLGGEGERPPEDTGGSGSFETYLEIIADKNHPQYAFMTEWAEPLRERARSAEEITSRLRHTLFGYYW